MMDEPKVSLRLPLYTLVLKNGKLAIGDGKAMLWTTVPKVKAFVELFKDKLDTWVVTTRTRCYATSFASQPMAG